MGSAAAPLPAQGILAMALIVILNRLLAAEPDSPLSPRWRGRAPGEGRGCARRRGRCEETLKAANITKVIFKLSGNPEAGDCSYKRHWLLT